MSKKTKSHKIQDEEIITIFKENPWLARAIDSLTYGLKGDKLKVLNTVTKYNNQLGE